MYKGGGSVVVDILFCTSHCLWGFRVGLCFGIHYFMSFLVLQTSIRGRKRELVALLILSCGCLVTVNVL